MDRFLRLFSDKEVHNSCTFYEALEPGEFSEVSKFEQLDALSLAEEGALERLALEVVKDDTRPLD